MYGFSGLHSHSKAEELDLESGETLYPGLSLGENQLRWGFIRKVYGILTAQVVLTTVVSAVTVLYSPVNDLLRGSPGLLLLLAILPLICVFGSGQSSIIESIEGVAPHFTPPNGAVLPRFIGAGRMRVAPETTRIL
ncbi:Bax inhibitor 1-related [Parasponia andersonii]|uniref:Bax inhibitor 1-related n=1 Tax=Parasponia andersonii TaxID=3476 RepID=A0A2P5E3U4_PARAD|nr:Bax inhibitor 1-related [Parasponia andersonii]